MFCQDGTFAFCICAWRRVVSLVDVLDDVITSGHVLYRKAGQTKEELAKQTV